MDCTLAWWQLVGIAAATSLVVVAVVVAIGWGMLFLIAKMGEGEFARAEKSGRSRRPDKPA